MRLGRLGGRLRRLSGVLRRLFMPLLGYPYLRTMRPGRRVLSPIWYHRPPQLAGGGPPNRRHPPAGTSRRGLRPSRCVSLGLRFGFGALTRELTESRLGCGRFRSIQVIGQVPALAQRAGEAMADGSAAG